MKLRFFLIFIGLHFLACKEASDNNPPPSGSGAVDPSTTLPSKTWVLNGQTATTSSGTTDEYAGLLSCDKDDEYKFSTLNTSGNGTFRYEEGTNSCNGTPNALIYNGNWKLSPNKDSLFLTQNGTVISSKFKIKTITNSNLVIELKGFSGSIEATYIYTYNAK